MMKNTRSLAVVSEESLITKIIRSLKNFLNIKKESKEENTNRRATVIKTEKIERRASKNITLNDLNNLENNISKNIEYINELDEDELDSLDEYYDFRINELESILNDKTIHVIIKNPKAAESSKFLSSGYINYEVETPEVGWMVPRRYSEFEWLRTVLVKFHPGHVVAPLPSKKIGSRRFEEDFDCKLTHIKRPCYEDRIKIYENI